MLHRERVGSARLHIAVTLGALLWGAQALAQQAQDVTCADFKGARRNLSDSGIWEIAWGAAVSNFTGRDATTATNCAEDTLEAIPAHSTSAYRPATGQTRGALVGSVVATFRLVDVLAGAMTEKETTPVSTFAPGGRPPEGYQGGAPTAQKAAPAVTLEMRQPDSLTVSAEVGLYEDSRIVFWLEDPAGERLTPPAGVDVKSGSNSVSLALAKAPPARRQRRDEEPPAYRPGFLPDEIRLMAHSTAPFNIDACVLYQDFESLYPAGDKEKPLEGVVFARWGNKEEHALGRTALAGGAELAVPDGGMELPVLGVSSDMQLITRIEGRYDLTVLGDSGKEVRRYVESWKHGIAGCYTTDRTFLDSKRLDVDGDGQWGGGTLARWQGEGEGDFAIVLPATYMDVTPYAGGTELRFRYLARGGMTWLRVALDPYLVRPDLTARIGFVNINIGSGAIYIVQSDGKTGKILSRITDASDPGRLRVIADSMRLMRVEGAGEEVKEKGRAIWVDDLFVNFGPTVLGGLGETEEFLVYEASRRFDRLALRWAYPVEAGSEEFALTTGFERGDPFWGMRRGGRETQDARTLAEEAIAKMRLPLTEKEKKEKLERAKRGQRGERGMEGRPAEEMPPGTPPGPPGPAGAGPEDRPLPPGGAAPESPGSMGGPPGPGGPAVGTAPETPPGPAEARPPEGPEAERGPMGVPLPGEGVVPGPAGAGPAEGGEEEAEEEVDTGPQPWFVSPYDWEAWRWDEGDAREKRKGAIAFMQRRIDLARKYGMSAEVVIGDVLPAPSLAEEPERCAEALDYSRGRIVRVQAADPADDEGFGETLGKLKELLGALHGVSRVIIEDYSLAGRLAVRGPADFPLYSERALASFREATGKGEALLPTREDFPKTDRTAPVEEKGGWQEWQRWVKALTTRRIKELAEAAREALAGQESFEGVTWATWRWGVGNDVGVDLAEVAKIDAIDTLCLKDALGRRDPDLGKWLAVARGRAKRILTVTPLYRRDFAGVGAEVTGAKASSYGTLFQRRMGWQQVDGDGIIGVELASPFWVNFGTFRDSRCGAGAYWESLDRVMDAVWTLEAGREVMDGKAAERVLDGEGMVTTRVAQAMRDPRATAYTERDIAQFGESLQDSKDFPVTIDGSLQEWGSSANIDISSEGAEAYSLPGDEQTKRGKLKVRVHMDDRNVYLGIEWSDQGLVGRESAGKGELRGYRGADTIEVGIGFPSKPWPAAVVGEDAYILTISPGEETSAPRVSFADGWAPVEIAGLLMRTSDGRSPYALEMAIPYGAFGLSGPPPMVAVVSAAVGDAEKWVGWRSYAVAGGEAFVHTTSDRWRAVVRELPEKSGGSGAREGGGRPMGGGRGR
ncbi:MAG: hypothetical protein V2A58_05975 [Planctomycetota bacterium]